MISEEAQKELEEIILRQIAQLEEQIGLLKSKTRPIEPDCSLGRLTRLEAMGEKQVNERILRESEQRLIRLKNALSRLPRKEFGLCIDCEEPIGLPRLRIRPESVRCIDCAP